MPTALDSIFPCPKPVVAVLHAGPSPGVPGGTTVACAVERVVTEARVLADLGVDGLLIENAHDAPWVTEEEMGPEVAAFMTRVVAAVKRHLPRIPVGVQISTGAAKTALAVAHVAGGDFVRCDTWAVDARHAGEALRYRKSIGADDIPIWADVRVSDAAWAGALATDAERHRADALVVAGAAVGSAPAADALAEIEAASSLPLVVGGGLAPENIADYLPLAEGFIVGRGCKEGGDWRAPVCERRVRALIGAVEYARGQEAVTLR